MPREELKKTLESLHEELSRTEEVDPEVRRLLTEVAGDIEQKLHDAEAETETESAESDGDLIDRVNDLGSHFEEQHPRLAQIIGRIADGLSQLGI